MEGGEERAVLSWSTLTALDGVSATIMKYKGEGTIQESEDTTAMTVKRAPRGR